MIHISSSLHTRKPRIGLSLDHEAAGGYSAFPWYALRANYMDSILDVGGIPLAIPHAPDLACAYADLIDGVVITGGAFDVDPSLFGASVRHDTVVTKPKRTDFEQSLICEMLARDKPVLGICGGQQILNVYLGGSLIQHIPDTVIPCLAHEQPNPRSEAGHDVELVPGTQLHQIITQDVIPVNSAHHQAVERVASPVRINARASDGVIEGIEDPRYRFCIGVQWHPEFFISTGDRRLLEAFIAAAVSGAP